MNLSDAVSHLYHFCYTLSPDPYSERAPLFFFKDHSPGSDSKTVSAKVVLPCSVDISVREAHSREMWATEKNAKRDVAFEAYVALYNAGLIDDHLLPIGRADQKEEESYAAVEKRSNIVEASEQIDIWPSMAEAWSEVTELHQTLIILRDGDQTVVEMLMLLPMPLPDANDFSLYWDSNTIFKVIAEPLKLTCPYTSFAVARQFTRSMLQLVFWNRMEQDRDDFTALYKPFGFESQKISGWNARHSTFDQQGKLDEIFRIENLYDIGLIRDLSHDGTPYIFHEAKTATYESALEVGVVDANQDKKSSYQLLLVRRFPKRADFLHEIAESDEKPKRGSGKQWLLAETCELDSLPMKCALFSSFIPSILHVVQKVIVVDQLCNTLLGPLQIKDRTQVATAISASSAREPNDYQRLEFLGDSILKLSTSLTLMAGNLKYHEGILSNMKDHIVSNSSLSSAAIKVGLDRFILTKAFTGSKWRPLYNSDFLGEKLAKRRDMSTKTLADVVESLIGVATLEGGLSKALDCLQIFLPHVPWPTASEADKILYQVYDRPTAESAYLRQLQCLLSYTFNCKTLLIEAITHPSHSGPNPSAPYERLEFLGDSVLDDIVTMRAFNHDPPIPTHRLHLVRSVLVNANFLGYLCIRSSMAVHRTEVNSADPKNISTYDTEVPLALWQAMRHSAPGIASAQQACLSRYNTVKGAISDAITTGMHYPWTLLARLEPPKFFSDIVESILGAIWIDSHGSISTCTAFLDRLGLVPYLMQIMENSDIALLHPKEELGRLADQDKVQYVVSTEEEKTGGKRLTCSVILGERNVVAVRLVRFCSQINFLCCNFQFLDFLRRSEGL